MRNVQSRPHPAPTASLAAWEDEGGATGLGAVMSPAAPEDRPVLEALGAAVVARWNELPTDARRALFEAAVAGRETSGRLARYLRAHRNDAA
ncbi:MAG: hypothetical protein EA355_13740 [Rhodobacteraceae bacterium]|nr:MAG: hypothetical protein EA355_13740 [Paracoccaceae bacterium]